MEEALREQAEHVARTLPRLMRQLFRVDGDDPAAALTVTQLRLCAVLSDGPMAMSAASQELGISLSAMTQIADRLERAGLVQRSKLESDRRVKVLILTSQATRLMRLRQQRRVRRVMRVLKLLPEEDRRELIAGLDELAAAAISPSARGKARRGKSGGEGDGDGANSAPGAGRGGSVASPEEI